MHERKALMASFADGFVALPGGFGTFDELCEMATWDQLGIHAKPLVLVNVDGYFDGFLAQIDRGVADGFLKPEHRRCCGGRPSTTCSTRSPTGRRRPSRSG